MIKAFRFYIILTLIFISSLQAQQVYFPAFGKWQEQEASNYDYDFSEAIKFAEKNGIYTIDTSPKYGDAEKILGKIGVRNWDVITKLPSLLNNNMLMSTQNLNKFVNDSLKRLRINSLYALLIHDPSDLKPNGLPLLNKLKKIKNEGKIKKIGVSITHFEDLKFIIKKLPIDIKKIGRFFHRQMESVLMKNPHPH